MVVSAMRRSPQEARGAGAGAASEAAAYVVDVLAVVSSASLRGRGFAGCSAWGSLSTVRLLPGEGTLFPLKDP